MRLRRGLAATLVVGLALLFASSAQAVTPEEVFVGSGEGVACKVLAGNGGIRECNGSADTTLTWDGVTKIDVNVFLPPESAGPGPYPTIGDFHGWGSSKQGLNQIPPETESSSGGFIEARDPRIQHWAEEGYAVFSMSDRGWGLSCGALDEAKAKGEPDCARGYNHLMDDRYEVRDAQYLLSRLADEGLVQPTKIGATGVSYGGGMSMALAALRNRTMEPSGALVPWTSPEGKAMELAAAVPQWPWTELSYALAPNGRNLDYVTESTYRGPAGNFPVGIMKYSWDEGLYQVGQALSNYNENDPEADIPGYIERLEAGEPYTDSSINSIIAELSRFHSSYSIDPTTTEPSPLLIQSGWNDDLFPVDEALRYYQRTRALYPSDPISLYFADYGHPRSQNKPADVAAFNARLEAWFAHYLKGDRAAPTSSVEAKTTTCPGSAPSEGPFSASDWSGLAPGEIRFGSADPQRIVPRSEAEEKTPTESSATFDPIVGPKTGKDACSSVPATDQPGIANYRSGAAPAGGFTLMGSPTITAKVEAASPNSEIAARLLDVSPEGTESLVARSLYRPNGGSQEVVFQLHAQGYRFAAGHVAKLELLPSDFPYGRFSNLQSPITVSNLELRLPVTEKPGSLGGLVQTPLPKVVPAGYTLAAEYATKSSGGGGGTGGGSTSQPATPTPTPTPIRIGAGGVAGRFTANRKAVVVPVRCFGGGACSGQVLVRTKRPGGKGFVSFAKGGYSLAQGTKTNVRLPLTKAGRKVVKGLLAKRRGSRKLAGIVQLNDPGRPSLTLKRPVSLTGGH